MRIVADFPRPTVACVTFPSTPMCTLRSCFLSTTTRSRASMPTPSPRSCRSRRVRMDRWQCAGECRQPARCDAGAILLASVRPIASSGRFREHFVLANDVTRPMMVVLTHAALVVILLAFLSRRFKAAHRLSASRMTAYVFGVCGPIRNVSSACGGFSCS